MNAGLIEKMLNEDKNEWEAFVALLDSHPEENLHDPESPPWTNRDVFAHLARWTIYSIEQLEGRIAGRKPPSLDDTIDEINIRWQIEDSRISLVEARERAIEAYEKWARTIESVPPEYWSEELELLAGITDGKHWHYALHRKYIIVE